MNREKVVGILGGMGPYSTVDFFATILSCTPVTRQGEHLRIIIDNNVKIPSRSRAILYNEESPVRDMIESINALASIGIDFVVVPCNTAHYFYDEIATFIKVPWLNMIEIVSEKACKVGEKALILGAEITIREKLYSKYLPQSVYLPNSKNEHIFDMIAEIKATGRLSPTGKDLFNEIITEYTDNVDSIVLACTELPIVFKDNHIEGVPVIDANLEYAKEVVSYARE